jgi:hypothetical protein
MKKLMVLFLFLLCVSAFADTGQMMGQVLTSKDWEIKNVTLLANNTVYGVTLDAGAVVQCDIYSNGGSIKWCKSGTLAEAYRTIPAGADWWAQLPMNFAKSTVLYFWTSASAPCTVEVFYNYR